MLGSCRPARRACAGCPACRCPHDVLGRDQFGAVHRDPELPRFSPDAGHLPVGSRSRQRRGLGAPGVQDARACRPGSSGGAGPGSRLGHHVLALLVLVDRVRQVRLGLSRMWFRPAWRRARQPTARPDPTDDGDEIRFVVHGGVPGFTPSAGGRGHQRAEAAQPFLEFGLPVGLVVAWQHGAQVGQALVSAPSPT